MIRGFLDIFRGFWLPFCYHHHTTFLSVFFYYHIWFEINDEKSSGIFGDFCVTICYHRGFLRFGFSGVFGDFCPKNNIFFLKYFFMIRSFYKKILEFRALCSKMHFWHKYSYFFAKFFSKSKKGQINVLF